MLKRCRITRNFFGALFVFLSLAGFPIEASSQSDSVLRAILATEAALSEARRKHGLTDQRTITYRRKLARLYELQGRFDEAAVLMRREADVLQGAEGGNSLNLSVTLNMLAKIYRKAGRNRESDEALAWALTKYRKQPVHRNRPPPPIMSAKPEALEEAVGEPAPVKAKPTSPLVQNVLPARHIQSPGLTVNGISATPGDPMVPRPPTVGELQLLEQANRLDQEVWNLWWQRRMDEVEQKFLEALFY